MTTRHSPNPSSSTSAFSGLFRTINDTGLLPIFGLICLGIIYLLDLNQTLFLLINEISLLTGETLWAAVTLFGDPIILVCLALSLYAILPRISFAIIPTLIIGGSAVMYFKWLFAVVRPSGVLQDIVIIGIPPVSGAFPSGHTAGAFALATLFMLLTSKPYIKYLILTLAMLVGISRIAVGVHWPLDVSAGIVLGWLSAIIGFFISKNVKASANNAIAINLLLLIFSIYLLFRNTGYNQVQLIQWLIAISGISIAAISLIKSGKSKTG